MSMVIQHNIPALQTYNIVNSTSNALQKSIAKLSSGLRINSAADDAAGLAISEKMRSQIRGLDRAVANTQDGISMIQTAEGALSETHSILQRMRELSVQAANDTLTQQDRSYIQEEVDQLKDEITRVGNTTQFNKKKLLDGSSSGLWSSSNMETKALIRGSLREVDQFGQKKSIEGNYKIRVKADPGQAEVQKSDIMTIKHPNVLTNKTVNSQDGVKDVQVDNMTPGTYKVDIDAATAVTDATITGSYGFYEVDKNATEWSRTQPSDIKFAQVSAGANNIIGKVAIEIDGNEVWSVLAQEDTANPGDFISLMTKTGNNVSLDTQKAYIDALDMDAINTAIQSYTSGGNTPYEQVTVTKATTWTASDPTNAPTTLDQLAFTVTQKSDDQTNLSTLPQIAIKFYTQETSPADPDNITYTTISTNAPTTSAGTPDAIQETAWDAKVNLDKSVSADTIFGVTSNNTNTLNGSVLFEVTNRDTENGTVTLKATATLLDQSGKNSTKTQDNIVIKEGGTADLNKIFGDGAVTLDMASSSILGVGDNGKFVAFVTAGKVSTAATSANLKLSGEIDENWDDTWENGPFGATADAQDPTVMNPNELQYVVNVDDLTNTEVHLKNFILNEKTGTVTEGDTTLITNKDFNFAHLDTAANGGNDAIANKDTLAAFTSSYIGKTASGDVKLRDLDKFWNSEGKFMLDDAKTLTLNQGNGNKATVTLYANDTLDEVATKINNAIATDLGQSKYVDDATKFATFVSKDAEDANPKTNFASQAVPGTFVIRSVVPGSQGEITFSGDQEILDALSLNTIQESKETRYSVDVLDEHSGKVLAQNVQTTGNVMYGVINENVDVEFGALSGISATWNNNLNKFTYESKMEETTLHIADNTTVLQIGANEGEDLAMDIGDMRSHALGLDGVNMMSHDRAARSITIIDNAIDKVSTQRAKLGAYQNRLEYTANNLTTASENLTSAESRIRDADMAKEMMQFTKLNIMLQAGNSMLAQANQQPQNVLSLIR